MIEMHSKYHNMHQNGMFYALICINNHIISCINCVLLTKRDREVVENTWSHVKTKSKLTNFMKLI